MPYAVVSIGAAVAAFLATYAIGTAAGANAAPAILTAALCIGLMRKAQRPSLRAMLLELATLPPIALGAALVGLAFHANLALGAALFTGGIVLSIRLREFGRTARAIGRTIALPLLAMLVVPAHVDAGGNRWLAILLVLAAGAIATIASTVASWIAFRLRIAPEPATERAPPSEQRREGKMSPTTRMALQMFVALFLAFAIGLLLVPAHWSWVVLTAFIVCSGTVARGEAIYKSVLRLGGAIGGTLAAALLANVHFPNAGTAAAVIFFFLFLAIWLRRINYAYWAGCITLVFALLQGAHGVEALPLFAMRVLGILIGALCGIAATWFVFPIRTRQLVRKRVAEALAALRATLKEPDAQRRQAQLAELETHVAELERIAPPVRLHRAAFRAHGRDDHPAAWIELMHELIAKALEPDADRAQLGAEMKRLGANLRAEP